MTIPNKSKGNLGTLVGKKGVKERKRNICSRIPYNSHKFTPRLRIGAAKNNKTRIAEDETRTN
uniref:Uncharacterized protein n=1 Tax=Arundo donax TaxID=35708 RepID=A0A0A9AU80_ARUDO